MENERLDLQAAVTQARALDPAQKNADSNRTHVSAMVDKTTFLHSVPDLPLRKSRLVLLQRNLPVIFAASAPIPVQYAPLES